MDLAALTASIKRHEGYRQLPYRDSLNLWTVGTGKLIDAMNVPKQFDKLGDLLDWLTDTQRHDNWLTDDISSAVAEAQAWLGATFAQLNDRQQNVIAEMAYQLGQHGLSKFVAMKAALVAGDFRTAAVEGLDSAWAKQTPERANELMRNLI